MAVNALTGVLIFLVLYLFWRINRYETFLIKVNKKMMFLKDKWLETKNTEELLLIKSDKEFNEIWNDMM